jgi:hypothetical protein
MYSFVVLIVTSCSGNSVIASITLFNEREADTFGLGKGNEGLLAVTNNENVGETGGEGVTFGILNVGNFVRTGVVFNVLEDTNTTDVVTTSDEN